LILSRLKGRFNSLSLSLSLCKMPLLYSVGAFLVFWTNVLNDMVKDHNTQLPYKRAILRDRKGDLSKEWFVEFYACSGVG
jgi:hypothetical protein